MSIDGKMQEKGVVEECEEKREGLENRVNTGEENGVRGEEGGRERGEKDLIKGEKNKLSHKANQSHSLLGEGNKNDRSERREMRGEGKFSEEGNER